ncbi:NAD(P)-binding protein [Xylariaceae sp. FL1272]|nr:NAD(P)-binding protein [Xylariaceae sp. FL1272]
MLVLVVGATGNIGQKIVDSLLRRGHQVRACARNPNKLSAATLGRLEKFVTSTAYYDVPALDEACAGVDAVICAYHGSNELAVEGQLMLLRAAERAGVRIYVAAGWNSDWRRQKLGDHDTYDAYHCFHQLAKLSSTIRPNYIISGILAEVLFSKPGRISFSPQNHGVWDPEAKRFEVWGDPARKWQWTSEADGAEFAVAIAEQENAAQGGFWTVCSGYDTLEDMAKIYGQTRGVDVVTERIGTVEDLRAKAMVARAQGQGHPDQLWNYIGYFYVLFIVDGTWTPCQFDNGKLGVKGTSLKEFLEQNSDI